MARSLDHCPEAFQVAKSCEFAQRSEEAPVLVRPA
jgi:hypothetical protein